MSASPPFSPQKADSVPQAQLSALLAKAAAYCPRPESSAFDFVCREEISETICPSLVDKSAPLEDPGWKSPKPTEEAYLNDVGRAAVRSKTEVIYKDFKFFAVEVEVNSLPV